MYVEWGWPSLEPNDLCASQKWLLSSSERNLQMNHHLTWIFKAEPLTRVAATTRGLQMNTLLQCLLPSISALEWAANERGVARNRLQTQPQPISYSTWSSAANGELQNAESIMMQRSVLACHYNHGFLCFITDITYLLCFCTDIVLRWTCIDSLTTSFSSLSNFWGLSDVESQETKKKCREKSI